jgi:hypothetical protein
MKVRYIAALLALFPLTALAEAPVAFFKPTLERLRSEVLIPTRENSAMHPYRSRLHFRRRMSVTTRVQI